MPEREEIPILFFSIQVRENLQDMNFFVEL